MAAVELVGVSKSFSENGDAALSDLSIRIEQGEFLVLVGPSGCGKTTALRIIAGLEQPTEGDVLIGGAEVNDVPPQERDAAMVFQSYALYPHMSVSKNLGFGLRMRGTDREQVAQRVDAMAEVLGLGGLMDRMPSMLSGGQRQRVAMGRALVRDPAIFLLDEPLSNLDAKLRGQMRGEIVRIQRELGITTVYVTHDQVEAMTMGHRIAVMDRGVLQQLDTPQAIYERPANVFVAGFIGNPPMNMIRAKLGRSGRSVEAETGAGSIRLAGAGSRLGRALAGLQGPDVIVGARPDDVLHVGMSDDPANAISGELLFKEALGNEQLMHVRVAARPVRQRSTISGDPDEGVEVAGEDAVIVVRKTGRGDDGLGPGSEVRLALPEESLLVFDAASGRAIR